LGQVCAKIRTYRKPEPYKGKGIKFTGEISEEKQVKHQVKNNQINTKLFKMDSKLYNRTRVKYRIRKKVSGTSQKPRLSVFRSNKEIYCQLIDDVNGVTISKCII
jgi:hypothetical protein